MISGITSMLPGMIHYVEGQIVTDGSNIVYDYFLVPDSVIAENHWAEMPADRNLCTDDRYLASNRQLPLPLI